MNPKTAAKWVEAYKYLDSLGPSVPLFLAKEVAKKYRPALAALMNKRPMVRLGRGVAKKVKTAQAVKKDLRKELEALCKAIVFTRDCGSPEAREGSCISCGKWTTLQWGHFIRQQDSKWLQYDPRNTGGQCGGCNGFAHGNVLKYAEAIDKRDGDGAAKLLQREAEEKDRWWRPNKKTLTEKYKHLLAYAKERGVPYAYPETPQAGPQ